MIPSMGANISPGGILRLKICPPNEGKLMANRRGNHCLRVTEISMIKPASITGHKLLSKISPDQKSAWLANGHQGSEATSMSKTTQGTISVGTLNDSVFLVETG